MTDNAEIELNREELQYGNAQCTQNHPLWLVAEGYARCHGTGNNPSYRVVHFAWRFTKPTIAPLKWVPASLEDGSPAWISWSAWHTLDECLAFIAADIDAHRGTESNLAPGPSLAEWRALVTAT